MNPTPRLRFVERTQEYSIDPMGNKSSRTIRVLQQWFAYDIQYPMTRGEWRDVRLENE